MSTPMHNPGTHSPAITCAQCPPKQATKVICKKCRKPARDHCPECMVCRPASNEHPYWCAMNDDPYANRDSEE